MENEPLFTRLRNAWNTFMNRDPTKNKKQNYNLGLSYSTRPDRIRLTKGNERSLVTSIFNRIALDVSSVDIVHATTDEYGRFVSKVNSGLSNCLNLEANIDQTSRAFIQDVVLSMLDEGCVAIIPVDTSENPNSTQSYEIGTVRVGKIKQWYPAHIRVEAYDDRSGTKKEIIVPKNQAAIIENPFYSVINEPNSTLHRLMQKLVALDSIDEMANSGKLNMIIQLPYVVKTSARKDQAEIRRQDIEDQLTKSKYGIAYVDSTEKVTQLSKPLENNLLAQIESLKNTFYSQMGITEEIMNGTANADALNNYYIRTIEPIVSAICDELLRKFVTKTARTRGQTIMFFRDPFKLMPITEVAEIADKFTRNEIMTSNEIRQKIGMPPSNDPKADELVNSNNIRRSDTLYPYDNTQQEYGYDDTQQEVSEDYLDEGGKNQNGL